MFIANCEIIFLQFKAE